MTTEARSGISMINLQEILDASGGSAKAATRKNLAQYLTPSWFAQRMASLLPGRYACSVVFDPQSGDDNLLDALDGYGTTSIGVELDRRFHDKQDTAERVRINANCVDVWRVLDEVYPDLTLRCQVANPPFGLRWKVDGEVYDSTVYTWNRVMSRVGRHGVGFFIANRATIDRLRLENTPGVWLYQTFPSGIFDAEVEIGVLHFHGSHRSGPRVIHYQTAEPEDVRMLCGLIRPPDYDIDGTMAPEVVKAFKEVKAILNEEKREQPPFNIYLKGGYLRTYLSTRARLTRRLTPKDVEKLAKIDKCHPLTLTTERESRLLMAELVECGTYTVQPEAKAAIEAALREVESIACPIMPITDFERVAYADDNEALEARVSQHGDLALTKGRRYLTETATYGFVNHYTRMRLHLSEGTTYAAEHDMRLTGQDRFISIKDDNGVVHRFLDRPDPQKSTDHSDATLWDYFTKPEVQTVAEKYASEVRKNLAIMDACEMLAGFEYFPGQRDFYSRVAVRPYALVGAATGTGKTLGAITLVALKAPQRALIVAPQGTTRGKKESDEDAVEDMQASQWITELRRFAPGLQVFEMFSESDYDRICALNHGVLPHGVYVTYYEAMFSNGGRESCSKSFDDGKLMALAGLPPPAMTPEDLRVHGMPRELAESVGYEKNGIRCIASPCLATRIGHLFDFVALDEAHKACHLSANVTQMIIRLQPKYRYAMTATPIPNLVSDIFPLMGWLCVPDWYKTGIRNAAWPYSREEAHRFSSTFLSVERDLTQEEMNKEAEPTWRGKCEKTSPIISAPARLLKLIKPTMAFISKEACNPNKPKVTVHDVRVPMGSQQAKLYGYYMNRAHVPHKNPMVKAAMQVAILRDLCASPAASDWNNVAELLVRSNFNPKTAAILSLIRDVLQRRQQVVVVCSRLKQSEYLQRKLAEAGIPVSRIDSSTTPDRHTEQANLFKAGRTPVMLMGIKCAQAHSFDLCPNLIVGSLEYSFGSFDQASGRIDRVTSKLPMNIWCVLHKNTIEEIMFDIVATKGDAATICLRGQRVPRDYVPADLGEVLAKNFQSFTSTPGEYTEETTVEAGWPPLCQSLRAAVANHPCQLARKG